MEMISEHISYDEATKSQAATRNNISNNPDPMELENMKLTAEKIFEPVRNHFGVPIAISSFFRNSYVNAVIGGARNSQHSTGEAMDIDADTFDKVTNRQIFDFIRENLEFDQLIWEFGNSENPGWVHASYRQGNNRKMILRAMSEGGRTKYIPFV